MTRADGRGAFGYDRIVGRHAALGALLVVATGCGTLPPEVPLTLDDTNLAASMKDDEDLEKRPFSDIEKAQSKGKLGGVWVQCYRPFQPRGDAAADLERLITQCGKPTGLAPVTPVRTGDPQSPQDPAQRFAFRVRAGRCYRVFAMGAPDVTDLDVAILDARGALTANDLSHDRWPVVPARGPLCFEHDGAATIEIAVVQGSGSFVLQVLGDDTAG
jgi:hypothetical protein